MFNPDQSTHEDDTLGGRISLAREATGLSSPEAAERLGVLAESWKSWECDRDVPRASRLTMMAGVLGVSPSWLLTGLGLGPSHKTDEAAPAELRRALRQASEDVAALNRRMIELASRLERQDAAAQA